MDPSPSDNGNDAVAMLLRQAASLLIDQGANPFRANAYRKAADTIAHLPRSARELFQEQGRDGLSALPGIGKGIAGAIAEILTTGRWAQLERLRGTVDPIATFRGVPGVGPELAGQIHDELHIDTLEALETACREHRLDTLRGIGARREAAICAAVTSMLDQRRVARRAPVKARRAIRVPVALLLDVDREYREQARAGKLPTIAPKRFNPDAVAWLPILHTARGPWSFTALCSNTARAHELAKTRDWVVIYAYDTDHAEQQCTVVTETHGKLSGRRVVRGRESQCAGFYRQQGTSPSGAPVAGAVGMR